MNASSPMVPAAEDSADWGALSSLPGNPIMWVLIISELLVFGAFFLGFGVARALDVPTFRAGQALLDIRLGGLNTLILITSGWLAALAVQARIRDERRLARLLLAGAMALGIAFLVVKGIEYQSKFELGYGLDSDTFFTLFFLMTGFHAMHVAMGVLVLAIVAWKDTVVNLETGTAFWHMVDLVWLILFPIVYLVR